MRSRQAVVATSSETDSACAHDPAVPGCCLGPSCFRLLGSLSHGGLRLRWLSPVLQLPQPFVAVAISTSITSSCWWRHLDSVRVWGPVSGAMFPAQGATGAAYPPSGTRRVGSNDPDRPWTYSRFADDRLSAPGVLAPSTTYANEHSHRKNLARYGYTDLSSSTHDTPGNLSTGSNRDAYEQPSGGYHSGRDGSSSMDHNAYTSTSQNTATTGRTLIRRRPTNPCKRKLKRYPTRSILPPSAGIPNLARLTTMQPGRDAMSLAEQRRAI